MAAADKPIAVTAECRSTAADESIKYLAMRPCEMRLLLFTETVARLTDDVGHLEGGPAHRLILLPDRLTSSGLETSIASSGLGTACRSRRDRCR